MKQVFTLLLSFAILSFANAQKSGKIYGSVKSADGRGVESATVSLLKAADQKLVKLGVTNKDGEFELEKIADGKFIITISATGYQTIKSDEFEISASNQTVNIGSLSATQVSKDLGNVSVTAKRPLIENKIDKTVVNVDASPTNTGLSALEVLEKSPGVLVDNNDNISVKGKSGVIILIDGKPSYLSGQDLANYLRNMPSNQLDQIEIMTQPSAKFDASGNSGIINIKTKKNKANGFNGSINNSMIFANYYKNTSGINFNWRKNKFNIFGNYGVALWEGFNEINITRAFRKDRNSPFNQYFEQRNFGRFSGYPHNFKLGVDFFASKNTTLGGAVSGLFDNRKFRTEGVNKVFDSLHNYAFVNNSVSQTHDPWTNLGYNLNFRHVLNKKGAEITADADYILYRTKGKQFSDNYLNNPDGSPKQSPFLLKGYLPADIDIYSFKSDYSQPLGKEGRLEAGIKSSFVKTDNDAQYTYFDQPANNWLKDSVRSNHFLYEENINAAYINVNQQFKKWGVQFGLRAEQTIVKGNQLAKSQKFDMNYTKIFPTTYISYKPNDKNTLGLSFGRRIERPGYQDLNPFQYPLDMFTYREGNPTLQPQFSYNTELSYNYKGQLNISLNYTVTDDIINDVVKSKSVNGENYTFQTKDNIANRKNIGLSINYNKAITKWYQTNIFFNTYNNKYDGYIGREKINIDFTSFNFNINNSFTFKKGWSAELSGFYNFRNLNSSAILAEPMGMFSVGVGKQVLKNAGTIRVQARDPFWLMRFRGYTNMDQFESSIRSRWDNRRLIISFNFRFGKQQQQQNRRRNNTVDETNRINLGGQQ